jgi:hypothetical protein
LALQPPHRGQTPKLSAIASRSEQREQRTKQTTNKQLVSAPCCRAGDGTSGHRIGIPAHRRWRNIAQRTEGLRPTQGLRSAPDQARGHQQDGGWCPHSFHSHAAIRRASAGICGTHCTGPNHELALVMTKERAGVMAKPSVLPQRTEFQRRRWHNRTTVWRNSARIRARDDLDSINGWVRNLGACT